MIAAPREPDVASGEHAVDGVGEALFNLVGAAIPSRRVREKWLSLMGVTLASGASVSRGLRVLGARGISLGEGAVVGEGTWLDGRGGLAIGAHTVIGARCMVWTAQHDLADPDFSPRFGAVTIGDRVFVGSNVSILPGVAIGDGAGVGGGSVVTTSVTSGHVVAGNPARSIGRRPAGQLRYVLDRVPRWR